MIYIKILYFLFGFLVLCNLIDCGKGLQCRIEQSASDKEMKKVIRKCMQKIGSNNNNIQNNFNNHNNNYQHNRDFNDEFMISSSSSSSSSDEQDNSNRLKNREHLQMKINNRNRRFSNNELKTQQQQQQNDRRNGNGNGNGNNQRNNNNNSNSNNGYQRNGNNNNGTEMMDRQHEIDRNCIVHCFFEEMNMLNNDDYPDKYKVLHILTKDAHEHDLREFYTDSIQECFHFLDMEQRRDKCTYSKTLINCMTDYARANCEDWHEHTIVFNN